MPYLTIQTLSGLRDLPEVKENTSIGAFDVRIERFEGTEDLHSKWTVLEKRCQRPFFLSWPWIDTWLTKQAIDPWIVNIEQNGETVGLGFFCEAQEVRHKILSSKQLCLNSTGDSEKDSITIEFNTFIAADGYEGHVWRAALNALRNVDHPKWDEIIVRGATEDLYESLSDCGYPLHLRARAGSAKVDLKKLRENDVCDVEGFISTLSKNTRSQIRRSIRLYEERGAIELERASSATEAWQFLQEGAPHHSKRWEEKGGGKAFEREEYVNFHKTMIDKYYGDGVLEVIRINTGSDPMAWIYNFIDRDHVYFYLGALVFEEDNRLKPGLVAHSYCVADHLKRGSHVYDFMGGENRYKTSLGEPGPTIVSFALQRPSLILRAEGAVRRIKNKLQKS